MLNLESPLSTISRNCKTDLIAIGGKTLMKVQQLSDNNTFKLHKVLKTARSNNKVGTTDLAWNNILDNLLASTTLLGSNVLVWDINQTSLNNLNQKVGSHSQLINRVNWSHHNPDILASCSQDGYLNIWDRKLKPDQPALSMYHKEKIRDCQFNPFNEHYILSSYVSGAVKLWDMRNPKSCFVEFIQHETDVLSVDWHPSLSNIFASGSMDKHLMVWDLNKTSPILVYKTSHGTSRVKWWKKNPQYILSSYQTNNFYASMWNINIDNMPEYIYKGHKDVVTGFCWDISEYIILI
jgi:WD40 repeat protein